VSVRPVLVVGLGHPDRGDDAVGPLVAREVARRAGPRVEVVEHEDPTDLALLWTGREVVVVVDAVSSGERVEPGTVHVLRTGAGRPPLGDQGWARTGRVGTHAFGLASAVELSRALERLPDEVTVVGVEAGGFDHGAPLSPHVAAAVPSAVAAVLALLSGAPSSGSAPLDPRNL
jgi:hydrogenase maturation protease